MRSSRYSTGPSPILKKDYAYRRPLPPPLIIPETAKTLTGAANAIAEFLTARRISDHVDDRKNKTVLLTGAGISVASGLADYRGKNGTYTRNKTYRPIYFHEFVSSHEARKRYWARSFLGWTSLHKSRPNAAHYAVRDLTKTGLLSSVITQNVDSFHNRAHPSLPVVELHGFLRSLVCLSCRRLMPRDEFQQKLSDLNPAWDTFLKELLETGALDTEDPEVRRKKGYRTNPDGDADVPGAPYHTFRYPACPACLRRPPILKDGSKGRVEVDADGAWSEKSDSGILKPNVIMFGESIPAAIKSQAEAAIDEAGGLVVVGSSLATYSAWRLVKKAFDQKMPIGILNMGGVRKETDFFPDHDRLTDGKNSFRASLAAEEVLPEVVKLLYVGNPSAVLASIEDAPPGWEIRWSNERNLGGPCIIEKAAKFGECFPIPDSNAKGDKGSSFEFLPQGSLIYGCMPSEDHDGCVITEQILGLRNDVTTTEENKMVL